MEDAPKFDWTNAEVDREDGTVLVRFLDPKPSAEMRAALMEVLREWDEETRGQEWGTPVGYENGVSVKNVEPTAAHSLKLYLGEAADHARTRLERNQQEAEAQLQREHETRPSPQPTPGN